MARCIECEHCKIDIDHLTNAEAKCTFSSKKGRVITWACTTYKSREDAMIRKVSKPGEGRVREHLNTMSIPYWCKLKDKRIDG